MTSPTIRLSFLGTPYSYDPQHIIAGSWSPDWYCRVYECPLREMMGRTAIEIAEELVRMVSGGGWAQQFKRTMRLGDKFTIGDEEWVYVPAKDMQGLAAEGFPVIPLPSWRGLAIAATTRPL